MVSLVERDRMLLASWFNAKYRVPDPGPGGEHYSVGVLGVIHDARLIVRDCTDYVDIVYWWPAVRKWTVTHQCRADEEAVDYECDVTYWQPLPPLPWG